MDMYVVVAGTGNKLFSNALGPKSNTLFVKPVITGYGISSFGSVTLSKGGTVVALRTLDGGSGYMSQNG